MSDFCQTCGGFMGGHSGAECERLRRERQPLLAQVATLTHRAEVAERELSEVHRGVESVRLHNARVARDAANDAAALWRERCNKAEQKVDDLRAKLARAEGVVAAARAVAREHDRYLSDEVGSMGHVDEACDALRAALATYEEG